MIIDTFAGLPDIRTLRSWLMAFTPYAGYVRLFGDKMAPAVGIRPEELNQMIEKNGTAHTVDKMLAVMSDSFMELDMYVQVLDALEVAAQGLWIHVEPGEMMTQPAVAAVVEARQKYPERFFLLPSFDLSVDLPQRLMELHEKIGLAGVTTLAFIDGVLPDHERYYPLYAKLDQLGLVLWNHTVNNWSDRHPAEFGHPKYVDRIACDFPNLRIVMGHGGWPWVLEAITVARRHPNVYLEPSSHRWKHLANPGSGWEPLMYYGNWNISDKILFGSLWQLLGIPLGTVIEEAKMLPLSEKSLQKWMFGNAKKLYGFPK